MTESTNLPARADHSGSSVDSKMAGFAGDRKMFMTSFNTDTPEGKVKLYNALTDAEQISDHLGETILLADFAVQVVEIADDQTGEMNEAIRAILIDKDGKPYSGISDGLLRSIQTIINVMGEPNTWAEPLPIRVVEERSRRGYKYFTAKLA